jgi:biotin operon repressor
VLGASHPLWRSGLMAKLTPAERLVLLFYLACANGESVAWPSVPRVAEATGYSERVVKRAVAHLRHLGLIVVDGRAAGYRPQYAPVRYRVLPEVTPTTPLEVTPTTRPEVTPRVSRGDAHDTRSNKEVPREVRRASGDAPKAAKNPALDTAKRILSEWWERQDPRPQQPYIAAAKVLAKALGNGWTETDLSAALNDIPTISGGSLDYWRRTRRATTPQTPADWLPNGGAVTTERTA